MPTVKNVGEPCAGEPHARFDVAAAGNQASRQSPRGPGASRRPYRGDWSSLEWADPEIEYVVADGPSPASWTGVAGMAEGMRDTVRAWEDFRIEAEEYRELDGERVLVLVHASGRGKTSRVELGQMRTEGASLFHVRDGKVTRRVVYFDRDRALADVGLAGEADSA